MGLALGVYSAAAQPPGLIVDEVAITDIESAPAEDSPAPFGAITDENAVMESQSDAVPDIDGPAAILSVGTAAPDRHPLDGGRDRALFPFGNHEGPVFALDIDHAGRRVTRGRSYGQRPGDSDILVTSPRIGAVGQFDDIAGRGGGASGP